MGVFTARPDWSHAGESAWSRIGKFQWLNRLATLELFAALGIARQNISADGFDLRHAQAFDLSKLSATLQVPRRDVEIAFCSPRRKEPIVSACYRVLQYCPTCIQRAYHATFFQMRFIQQCPVHQERLKRACPVCNRAIPYRLNRGLVQHPYSCDACGHALYLQDESRRARAMQNGYTSAEVELFGQWQRYIGVVSELGVTALPERARDEAGNFTRQQSMHVLNNFARRLRFLREIQRHYKQPPPLPAFDDARQATLLNNLPLETPPASDHFPRRFVKRWPHLPMDYDWYSHHYGESLKRRLRLQGCDEPLAWHIQSVTGSLIVRPPCSPESVALTAWRFTWEGLHQPRTRRRRFPLLGLLEWWAFAPDRPAALPIPIWQIALRKRFKRDLERSYLHWLEIAKWMQSRNIYLVNRRMLSPGMLWIDPDHPRGKS